MCKPLTEEEKEDIANRVASKLKEDRGDRGSLSKDDVRAIKDIIHTKKTAVKFVILIASAAVFWALKDIYTWIAAHLAWGG